jgi:hypothetical protein
MTDYERGMMDALRIMKEQRDALEKPLRTVDVGPGYVALNALSHWGQSLTSATETAVLNHLMSLIPKREGSHE